MLHIDYKLEYTHEEMVEFVKEEIKRTEKLMKYNFRRTRVEAPFIKCWTESFLHNYIHEHFPLSLLCCWNADRYDYNEVCRNLIDVLEELGYEIYR